MTRTANPFSPTTSPSPATQAGNGTHGSESSSLQPSAPGFMPISPSGSQSTFELSLTLPWPPRDLSPNHRVHWAAKAKAAKAYRSQCWLLTLAEYRKAKKSGLRIDPDRAVRLHLLFVPPNRRAYDRDNLVSWCKQLFDGIADALVVNDRMFRLDSIEVSEELGGMVKVEIRQ